MDGRQEEDTPSHKDGLDEDDGNGTSLGGSKFWVTIYGSIEAIGHFCI